jgi:hypothetical protein
LAPYDGSVALALVGQHAIEAVKEQSRSNQYRFSWLMGFCSLFSQKINALE